jgi:hypothetical protein
MMLTFAQAATILRCSRGSRSAAHFNQRIPSGLFLIFDPLEWRDGVDQDGFARPPVVFRVAMRAFRARKNLGQLLDGVSFGLNAGGERLARPRTLEK